MLVNHSRCRYCVAMGIVGLLLEYVGTFPGHVGGVCVLLLLVINWYTNIKGCLLQLAQFARLEVHNEDHSGDSCVCCSGAAGASKDL